METIHGAARSGGQVRVLLALRHTWHPTAAQAGDAAGERACDGLRVARHVHGLLRRHLTVAPNPYPNLTLTPAPIMTLALPLRRSTATG